MDDDQSSFGFHATNVARTEPDPGDVREDMLAILAEARNVSAEAPWDHDRLRYHRLIFPHLASWLPEDEGEQLCFEFQREAARIELLLAA